MVKMIFEEEIYFRVFIGRLVGKVFVDFGFNKVVVVVSRNIICFSIVIVIEVIYIIFSGGVIYYFFVEVGKEVDIVKCVKEFVL